MYTKMKLSQRKFGLIFLIFLCPSFLSSCGYAENDSYVHTNHYADYESWASDIIYQREKHGTETDPLLTFDPSELNPRSYPYAEYSITGVGWVHAKKYKDPGASYMSGWESLGVFNYCCMAFTKARRGAGGWSIASNGSKKGPLFRGSPWTRTNIMRIPLLLRLSPTTSKSPSFPIAS